MKTNVKHMVVFAALSLVIACRTHDTDNEAAAAGGRDHSLGVCRVALNAPAPCVEYRGKEASGVAPGCTHDDCTAAKQNARVNLLTGIPAQCGAYIQCNDPCRCIQKNAAGVIHDIGAVP